MGEIFSSKALKVAFDLKREMLYLKKYGLDLEEPYRDLVVEVLAKGQDAEGITVGDVMSDHLMLVVENESLWNVIQRMRSEGVRRVPVVDSGGALVGILSVDDMLQLLGDELSALGRLIGNEQEHEARRRDQP